MFVKISNNEDLEQLTVKGGFVGSFSYKMNSRDVYDDQWLLPFT